MKVWPPLRLQIIDDKGNVAVTLTPEGEEMRAEGSADVLEFWLEGIERPETLVQFTRDGGQ